MTQQLTQFSSLSGSDISAVFGNYKFGSIQMLKYAISREKAPVHTLGNPNARAIARGKRSINGAFVFTMIDRETLTKAMTGEGTDNQIFLKNDELANYTSVGRKAENTKGIDGTTLDLQRSALKAGGSLGYTGILGDKMSQYAETSIFSADNFGKKTNAYLADQLLPFDITLVGTPEYGTAFAKRMIIKGVEITTEASGTSIDDMVIEKQHAFIANSIDEWTNLADLTQVGTIDRFASW